MKDFNGAELEIGDTVAMISPYVKGLMKAKVVGFTAKMVQCEWKNPFFRYGLKEHEPAPEVISRSPSYVAKIAG